MEAGIDLDEMCLTVTDVAKRLKVDGDTVRRLFIDDVSERSNAATTERLKTGHCR